MIIKTLTVGSFQVNNYLVVCQQTNQAVLIDAGGDYELTKRVAKENNAEIKYILNTHGHLDHIAGDYDFQTRDGVKVYAHKDDEFLFNSLKEHLTMFGMPHYETPKIDVFIDETSKIVLGELEFSVIHTPGHSPGSVCYMLNDGIIFAGDTIFMHSVGRTDLPGGSYEQLENSIRNKIFKLDEGCTIYSGHGPATTVKNEKEHNPFFGTKSGRTF